MAPSASMLFLSYHQLHQPAEAAPRKEEAAAAGAFRRLSLSSALRSLPMFERRREAAPAVWAEGKMVRERDAGDGICRSSPPPAAAAANKELEEKFDEALRLSCLSS
ncbi:uncharacterized protein LOC120691280 [Panicum virgatum]|uniref:Uncharacterized protein n=1 Tax=Panicum virgatum TaxID=38727 RepID=A0A8T0MGZ6_PANVG|nr:uncharacterized protein LOC120691280 [Panicum virgatum]KAG2535583.1 hypothetical protein PVAP13_9NG125100 [Panicum virgatum]